MSGSVDPSLRDSELGAAFADVWCEIVRVRQPIGHQSRSSSEVGRRLLHCRSREPAPGTPSRRVVAEGTLIGE